MKEIKAQHDLRRPSWTQAAVVHQMEWNIQRVLNNDTSAISTLRCLKLYLERLGCNFLDQESVSHVAVGRFPSAVAASPRAPELVNGTHWESSYVSVA